MAILKHIASKNADYAAAFNYLVYKHDEYTQKPILDGNGQMQLRDEYYLDGLLCNPLEFARACKQTNERFHKNRKKDEIKSHHYILSFDPKDREENGLTGEEAQRMGLKFAAESFPGHQALVCTHTDGHNGSGNIHVHIVINSVRAKSVERRDFMERPCDSIAGNKHHLTKDYLKYLKQQVMTMCRKRQLYQVDLLNPALDKVTEQEYWAERRGQKKLDKRNAKITQAGLTPRTTKFETQKETLRKQISEIAAAAKSFEEFQKALLEKYGISVRDKRGRYSYTVPDREKPISARILGAAYDRDHLLGVFAGNLNNRSKAQAKETRAEAPRRGRSAHTAAKIRLVVDLENCIKAQQSRAYAQKVKITNLQQMAQTLAFVKAHEYASAPELEQALADATARSAAVRKELKDAERKLADINKQIRLTGQYLAGRDIYAEYRKSGKSQKFCEEHRAKLALYESARDALREINGGRKFTPMKALKDEKERLTVEKAALHDAHQAARTKQKELQTAFTNVKSMLGLDRAHGTTKTKKQHSRDIS